MYCSTNTFILFGCFSIWLNKLQFIYCKHDPLLKWWTNTFKLVWLHKIRITLLQCFWNWIIRELWHWLSWSKGRYWHFNIQRWECKHGGVGVTGVQVGVWTNAPGKRQGTIVPFGTAMTHAWRTIFHKRKFRVLLKDSWDRHKKLTQDHRSTDLSYARSVQNDHDQCKLLFIKRRKSSDSPYNI